MDVQTQNALRGAGAQNTFGGLNDLASLGILAGQYGSFGKRKNSNTGALDNYNLLWGE